MGKWSQAPNFETGAGWGDSVLGRLARLRDEQKSELQRLAETCRAVAERWRGDAEGCSERKTGRVKMGQGILPSHWRNN